MRALSPPSHRSRLPFCRRLHRAALPSSQSQSQGFRRLRASSKWRAQHNTRRLRFHVSLPPEGSVYDLMFDFSALKWVSWQEHLKLLSDFTRLSMTPGAFIPFGFQSLIGSSTNTGGSSGPGGSARAFILTADTLPAIYLLRMLLTARSNILVSGPSGVGKTSMLNALLHSAKDWIAQKKAADDDDDDQSTAAGGTAAGAAAADGEGAAEEEPAPADAEEAPPAPSGDGESTLAGDDLSAAAAVASSTGTGLLSGLGAKSRNGREAEPVSPFDIIYLTLSSQSSARGLKRMLEGLFTRRRKMVLGPPMGKTAVLWVDDLNAAGRDAFDAQAAVEVLRQWTICGGWHDEESSRTKDVVDTCLLGCVTTSAHAKPFPRRFLSHLAMVALPPISQTGFHAIFTDMVRRNMSTVTTMPVALVGLLVEATLDLYRKVVGELLPTPAKPHYVFSILHVSQVFQSIFHATRPSRGTPEQLVRVWQHECLRVFHDRLTEAPARKWMTETVQEVTNHFLSEYAPSAAPDPSEILLCTFATSAGGYELTEHVLRRSADADTAAGEGDMDVPDGGPVDPGTPGSSRKRAGFEEGGAASPSGPASPSGAAALAPSPTKARATGGLLRVSLEQNAAAAVAASGGDPASPSPGGISRRDPRASEDAPGTPTTPMPQMKGDAQLERLYDMGAWVDDGRPMRAVIEERLLLVAQEFADQFAGGRGPGQDPVFVFRNALMHLARISRVLSMDQGHLMLLGPPGCGRRTLAKLASHMCRCTLLEAKLKDEQKGFAWRDMIKTALLSSGVQGRPVCLLLVDMGRPCSRMLDDVDQLMSTGGLPNIFKPEELTGIAQQLKPVARAAGLVWTEFDRTGASDNVLRQYFVERCRANLHFVLVVEGEPAALQRKVVAFPKVFQRVTVNAVDEWDEEARMHVAERFLISPEQLAVEPEAWSRVLRCAVDMHGALKPHVTKYNARAGYNTAFGATAVHFLRLLRLLRAMVPHRRQVVSTARHKYLQGVAKMMDMQDKLSALKGQISSMAPELERSRGEVEALMLLIGREKAEAEAAVQRFMPAEEAAMAAVAECEALRVACDAALRDVMPPLQAALRELRRIDKSSIAELKVMRSPPQGVKLVLRCICIMLGRIPPLVQEKEARAARSTSPGRTVSPGRWGGVRTGVGGAGESAPEEDPAVTDAWWSESIKLLADFHFLDMLLGYDKDSMTEEVAAKVEVFVADPMFDPVAMLRVSQAAATICKWVKAMDAFQKGRKLVEPAREALRQSEERLKDQEGLLAENHQRLTAMRQRIVELEEKLDQAQDSRDRLDTDMAQAQRKSEHAQRTITAVVHEVGRWKSNAELQERRHSEVLGEVLLSAAHIAYLGPVSGTMRVHVEEDWQELLKGAGVVAPRPFRLADVLAGPAQQDTWRDSGLPHSRTALENAGVMAACGGWVLLHDPQELGHRFIKGFYGGDVWLQGIGGRPVVTFVVLDQSDPNYTEQLFRAVETGATVLLENFDDDMDDITEQLLQCRLVGDTRGATAIRLGDNSIPYHKDFQLFVTTRLRSPRFPADVLRHVTVVNFSITRGQLCELLITATLRHEMPDLESEHLVLMRQRAKGEADLAELEDLVLQSITDTSTEELLEESHVYQLLRTLQESTDAIKAKVARIEESQKAISVVRADTEKYFVARVVPFFFCLADLANVRHTYQFGLHWFMRLFNDALVTCLRNSTGKARLASLTMHFTTMFYTNVSRSLFDDDKLPFAVMMMVRFLEASGYVTKDEANLLLFGRATDSTYTAKPTFMRLASARAGLGRIGRRPGGGSGAGGGSRRSTASGSGAAPAGSRRRSSGVAGYTAPGGQASSHHLASGSAGGAGVPGDLGSEASLAAGRGRGTLDVIGEGSEEALRPQDTMPEDEESRRQATGQEGGTGTEGEGEEEDRQHEEQEEGGGSEEGEEEESMFVLSLPPQLAAQARQSMKRMAAPAAPRSHRPWVGDAPLTAVASDSPRESIFRTHKDGPESNPFKEEPSGGSAAAEGSSASAAGPAAEGSGLSQEPSAAGLASGSSGSQQQLGEVPADVDPLSAMFVSRRGGKAAATSRLARAAGAAGSAPEPSNGGADGSNGALGSQISFVGLAKEGSGAVTPPLGSARGVQPGADGGAAGADVIAVNPSLSLLAEEASGGSGRTKRLSGLLPTLLSNDASAPAYMPEQLRPEWMPEESWSRLRDLGKLQPYNRVLPQLFGNGESVEAMRTYFEALSALEIPSLAPRLDGAPADPIANPPHPRLRELNTFQRLLVVRCLQPRGFVAAAQAAVREYLGPACVANEQMVDFDAIFAVTESTMPIVLISSSDHTLPFLQQFADSRGISVMHMAIGRGQGAATDRLIRAAVGTDRWVILENSHLAGDWMPSLCRLVQALPLLKPNIHFRLWLTTAPTSAYPDIILQASLKLVMDPPHGIKANLLQVMSQLPVEVSSNSRFAQQSLPSYGTDPPPGADPSNDVIGRKVTILSPDWKQLMLRLCLFHATLTERLQYRSLGWRRPYDFTAADMLSAISQAMSIVHGSGGAADIDAAMSGLQHVVGQCLYGGKVTHDWDRRLLGCLLAQQLAHLQLDPAAATVESLLPPRLAACSTDLFLVAKEVRSLPLSRDDPRLVGLPPGAASVRAAQFTRHVLDTLKRVQLLRSTAGHEEAAADLTRPLQLALSVCQDLMKQLPATPLPASRSGWVALVGAAGGSGNTIGPTGGPGGAASPTPRSGRPPGGAAAGGGAAGGAGGAGGSGTSDSTAAAEERARRRAEQQQAAAAAAAAAAAMHIPRYKAMKMTEEMSDAALERWQALSPVLQRAMVQVFSDEVGSYAAVLTAVHESIRTVNAAIKGYESVSDSVAELVTCLAQGSVPRSWQSLRCELSGENVAVWLSDLQQRLEFLYEWAVEGPPLAVPLGMLSRPRSFLTAVQQSFAEALGRPVGQVVLEPALLQQDEEQVMPRDRLALMGAHALATTPLTLASPLPIHSNSDASAGGSGSRMSTPPGGDTGGLGTPPGTAEGGVGAAAGTYTKLMLSEALSEGCLVTGLVLQGARWDRAKRCLAEPEPGVLHSAMPLLWLRATSAPAVPQLTRALALPGATVPTRIGDRYVCPVFKFVAGFSSRSSSMLADSDDCLATLLLPAGPRRPEFWAAHNVSVTAHADPSAVLDVVAAPRLPKAAGASSSGN